jgi:mono/diheme cytochrome c family protein
MTLFSMPRRALLVAALAATAAAPLAMAANSAQNALAATYFKVAPGDAARGEAFFRGTHTGGKPDATSCTACHTSNLRGPGRTKAGKEIGPMAASLAPQRYTDAADVEKWFKRNCAEVLGRECSAQEKSDVLAFLLSL